MHNEPVVYGPRARARPGPSSSPAKTALCCACVPGNRHSVCARLDQGSTAVRAVVALLRLARLGPNRWRPRRRLIGRDINLCDAPLWDIPCRGAGAFFLHPDQALCVCVCIARPYLAARSSFSDPSGVSGGWLERGARQSGQLTGLWRRVPGDDF